MTNGFKTSFTQLMEKGQNIQIIRDTIIILTMIMKRSWILFPQNDFFWRIDYFKLVILQKILGKNFDPPSYLSKIIHIEKSVERKKTITLPKSTLSVADNKELSKIYLTPLCIPLFMGGPAKICLPNACSIPAMSKLPTCSFKSKPSPFS